MRLIWPDARLPAPHLSFRPVPKNPQVMLKRGGSSSSRNRWQGLYTALGTGRRETSYCSPNLCIYVCTHRLRYIWGLVQSTTITIALHNNGNSRRA